MIKQEAEYTSLREEVGRLYRSSQFFWVSGIISLFAVVGFLVTMPQYLVTKLNSIKMFDFATALDFLHGFNLLLVLGVCKVIFIVVKSFEGAIDRIGGYITVFLEDAVATDVENVGWHRWNRIEKRHVAEQTSEKGISHWFESWLLPLLFVVTVFFVPMLSLDVSITGLGLVILVSLVIGGNLIVLIRKWIKGRDLARVLPRATFMQEWLLVYAAVYLAASTSIVLLNAGLQHTSRGDVLTQVILLIAFACGLALESWLGARESRERLHESGKKWCALAGKPREYIQRLETCALGESSIQESPTSQSASP